MGRDIKFTRSFAGSRIIRRGDLWRNVPEPEASQWIAAGHAVEMAEAVAPRTAEVAALIHAGAGWYILPDGQRIRGKEAAEAALKGGE
jgi:hypothetical protein